MEPAVAARGADVVWSEGLKVLGYPPTWAHTMNEVARVVRAVDVQSA